MVSLRTIHSDDKERIFKWRNDQEIISFGTTQSAVSPEEHQLWFQESLYSNKRRIYIIEYDRHPIGQLRFDRDQNSSLSCFISIYLFSNRQRGIGTKALTLGISKIREEWDQLNIIKAEVLKNNLSSQKFFLKNSFVLINKGIDKMIYHYIINPNHVDK